MATETSLTSFLAEYKQILKDYNEIKTSNAEITTKINNLPTTAKIEEIIETLTAANKTSIEKTISSLDETVDKMLSRLNYVLTAIGLAIFIGGIAFVILNFMVKAVERPIEQSKHIERTVSGDTSKPHVDYIDKDGNKIAVPINIPPNNFISEVHK